MPRTRHVCLSARKRGKENNKKLTKKKVRVEEFGRDTGAGATTETKKASTTPTMISKPTPWAWAIADDCCFVYPEPPLSVFFAFERIFQVNKSPAWWAFNICGAFRFFFYWSQGPPTTSHGQLAPSFQPFQIFGLTLLSAEWVIRRVARARAIDSPADPKTKLFSFFLLFCHFSTGAVPELFSCQHRVWSTILDFMVLILSVYLVLLDFIAPGNLFFFCLNEF